MKVNRPSGVRKYLRRTLRQRLRQGWQTRHLASRGDNLFIEENVHLMRHPECLHLGSDVILKAGTRICPTNPDAKIVIGDYTTIGYDSCLFATVEITVGANCLIAPHCYLVDSNHGIRRDSLIREQDMSARRIEIADDVWIGAKAVILKGVKIGKGAVVGAGSVVSEDVPEYNIVSGNPSTVVGERR